MISRQMVSVALCWQRTCSLMRMQSYAIVKAAIIIDKDKCHPRWGPRWPWRMKLKDANVIGGKSALLLGCFRPNCHGGSPGSWECELRYVLRTQL